MMTWRGRCIYAPRLFVSVCKRIAGSGAKKGFGGGGRCSTRLQGVVRRAFVEVLVALRAGVVHVAVMVHQVAVAQDAREPAVHHRAPEDVSELRDSGPDVVSKPGAARPAVLLKLALGLKHCK